MTTHGSREAWKSWVPEDAREHIGAAENAMFLLAADHVGQERGAPYLGRSLIVGPEGEILAEAGRTEETMLIADLDFSRSDQKHRVFKPGEYEIDLLRDRRPELYGLIVEQRL